MRPCGWALIQYVYLYKKRKCGHRYAEARPYHNTGRK